MNKARLIKKDIKIDLRTIREVEMFLRDTGVLGVTSEIVCDFLSGAHSLSHFPGGRKLNLQVFTRKILFWVWTGMIVFDNLYLLLCCLSYNVYIYVQ